MVRKLKIDFLQTGSLLDCAATLETRCSHPCLNCANYKHRNSLRIYQRTVLGLSILERVENGQF